MNLTDAQVQRLAHAVVAGLSFFGAGLITMGHPEAGAFVVLIAGSVAASAAAFGPKGASPSATSVPPVPPT